MEEFFLFVASIILFQIATTLWINYYVNRQFKSAIETLAQEILILRSAIIRLVSVLSPEQAKVSPPLLLICGDEAFCTEDAIQLRRARIWFRHISKATKDVVEKELMRRRQSNTLYDYVHIAAHGDQNGIYLHDGLASPAWINSVFVGVRLIFLASCAGPATADIIAGVVPYVVSIYGRQESSLISRFTYSFWREIAMNKSVEDAYTTAITEVPELAPFVDLRKT